jgi:hypothetical protein
VLICESGKIIFLLGKILHLHKERERTENENL